MVCGVWCLVCGVRCAVCSPARDTTQACSTCKVADNDDRMLLCDGCDKGFHMYCMAPQLVNVPTGQWFCEHCRPQRNSGTHDARHARVCRRRACLPCAAAGACVPPRGSAFGVV